jgi:LmbE family N-acetylglucosaminyl deacetylase
MRNTAASDAREVRRRAAVVLGALGDASLPATIPVRGVVIVAHPDDEVIGAGGRLARWRDVAVVNVTDGAPRDMRDARALGLRTRDAYAAVRRAERRAALELAGIDTTRIHDLGVVDQEASGDLERLTLRVVECLRELAPDVVLTHPYEGGHPDHDATAFAVHAAIALMRRRGARAPVVVEGSSYHLGAGGIVTGSFLPHPRRRVHATRLDAASAAMKSRMLARHVTQRATLQSFRSDIEPIRLAPAYDFSRAPHEGRLFYEHFPWGIMGAEWRAHAVAAWRALGLEARSAA